MSDIMTSDRLERFFIYQSVAEIATVLNSNLPDKDLCNILCSKIKIALPYPEKIAVRVAIGAISCTLPRSFSETPWKISKSYISSKNIPGILELFFPDNELYEQEPLIHKEYTSFIDTIATLASGLITKDDFEHLLLENIERKKELLGIEKINNILKQKGSSQKLLQEICVALPASWKHPEGAGARITYGGMTVATPNFQVTSWMQKQAFEVPGGENGSIDLCYTCEFPEEDEGPFLTEERSLLNNIAHLLSVALGCKMHDKAVVQNKERLKELMAINQTTAIIMKGLPIDETLQRICNILPGSWQYPENAAVKITFGDREFVSRPFVESPVVQYEQFITFDNQLGTIQVYYLEIFPEIVKDPFLKEEKDLISNIARLIAHYLNNEKGRRILKTMGAKVPQKDVGSSNKPDRRVAGEAIIGPRETSKTRYVIRSILVVASIQDAYLLAAESHDLKQVTDPFHCNNSWHIPTIRFAYSIDQAEVELENDHFDMVFIIATSGNQQCGTIVTAIKSRYPGLTVNIVAKSAQQIVALQKTIQKAGFYQTTIFSYEDNPNLIFYLCKLHEDALNSDQFVAPTLLLVEDAPEYYTPMVLALYRAVFSRIPTNPSLQDTMAGTRIRLLLACNYEDAVQTASLHAKYLVGVFSDVEFPKNGTTHLLAGFELFEVISTYSSDVNFILHSTEKANATFAEQKKVSFLHKGSPSFSKLLCKHIDAAYQLVLMGETGEVVVEKFTHFLEMLPRLKPEQVGALSYDITFLNWLKVQGLFDCAEQLSRLRTKSLSSSDRDVIVRGFLHDAHKKNRYTPIVRFNPASSFSEETITIVSTGSLGGKGKNIAFLHSLTLNDAAFDPQGPIKVCTPVTLIIRSDEFTRIIETDSVIKAIRKNDFTRIQSACNATALSDEVVDALDIFLQQITTPLAVRSSSLLEDSATQPFAGTFETYIIPNNHPDHTVRLQQLVMAIKRVYASPFKPEAQLYYNYTGTKPEDDRMAIVLQQLVGLEYDSYFYPQMSGVAGSYNFYPVGHMKPEDGFVVMAFGLGVYVVEGRSGHRFSPAYPQIDFGSTDNLLNGSQVHYYAVDLKGDELNFAALGEKAGLELLDIDEAETHGSLTHCASVYDSDNDRIVSDLRVPGPRIVDFADILKYNYLPLAPLLHEVLGKLASFMGSPVEIEFALNTCNRARSTPSLYLLQVRPLSGDQLGYSFATNTIAPEKCLLFSQTSLGNGRITDLTDIVIVDSEHFDQQKTDEMVIEVEYFNRLQIAENRRYIIIGPGRWGTRDKSLGIPVSWSQLCNAKVIVELGMENFPLDASLGSHFFHNITVMKTGYIAINSTKSDEFINWEAFNSMQCIKRLKYFKLLRSDQPLNVELDGKNKQARISRN